MKKLISVILIFIATIFIINGNNANIDEMIRIRVIANSNSEYDQKLKMNVSNELSKNLYNLLKDETNVNNARTLIKNNLRINFGKVIKTNEMSSQKILEKLENDVKTLILKNR